MLSAKTLKAIFFLIVQRINYLNNVRPIEIRFKQITFTLERSFFNLLF